jgi:predicted aconitase
MDKDFLKKQYNKDLEKLREMMNDWDPMALISLGCPKAEYDEYTNRLLSILYRYKVILMRDGIK